MEAKERKLSYYNCLCAEYFFLAFYENTKREYITLHKTNIILTPLVSPLIPSCFFRESLLEEASTFL